MVCDVRFSGLCSSVHLGRVHVRDVICEVPDSLLLGGCLAVWWVGMYVVWAVVYAYGELVEGDMM